MQREGPRTQDLDSACLPTGAPPLNVDWSGVLDSLVLSDLNIASAARRLLPIAWCWPELPGAGTNITLVFVMARRLNSLHYHLWPAEPLQSRSHTEGDLECASCIEPFLSPHVRRWPQRGGGEPMVPARPSLA